MVGSARSLPNQGLVVWTAVRRRIVLGPDVLQKLLGRLHLRDLEPERLNPLVNDFAPRPAFMRLGGDLFNFLQA